MQNPGLFFRYFYYCSNDCYVIFNHSFFLLIVYIVISMIFDKEALEMQQRPLIDHSFKKRYLLYMPFDANYPPIQIRFITSK